MKYSNLHELLADAELHGFHSIDRRIQLNIPTAEADMRQLMDHFTEGRTVWHPEYDQVAAWLQDNKRRGLLLQGTPGLGKTLLCHRVLPLIIAQRVGLWGRVCSAVDLERDYERICQSPIIYLDDVGTEQVTARQWGNQHCYFNELIDLAEKRDKLLVITTNLTVKDLFANYGQRADRLRSLVHPITIQGMGENFLASSHRGRDTSR